MSEKRLITFRKLKKSCLHAAEWGCLHEKNDRPCDCGKCSARTCPIFRSLRIGQQKESV